jgi:hypothetical protein
LSWPHRGESGSRVPQRCSVPRPLTVKPAMPVRSSRSSSSANLRTARSLEREGSSSKTRSRSPASTTRTGSSGPRGPSARTAPSQSGSSTTTSSGAGPPFARSRQALRSARSSTTCAWATSTPASTRLAPRPLLARTDFAPGSAPSASNSSSAFRGGRVKRRARVEVTQWRGGVLPDLGTVGRGPDPLIFANASRQRPRGPRPEGRLSARTSGPA